MSDDFDYGSLLNNRTRNQLVETGSDPRDPEAVHPLGRLRRVSPS